MWIWWALTSNMGLGAIMVFAAGWPREMQQAVTYIAIGVYAAMLLVVIATAIRPGERWRPSGLWFTFGLWVAQIGWAAYGLAIS
jgi:hypothetical protein